MPKYSGYLIFCLKDDDKQIFGIFLGVFMFVCSIDNIAAWKGYDPEVCSSAHSLCSSQVLCSGPGKSTKFKGNTSQRMHHQKPPRHDVNFNSFESKD